MTASQFIRSIASMRETQDGPESIDTLNLLIEQARVIVHETPDEDEEEETRL